MLKYSQKLSRRIISMSHEGLKHHELLINNLRLKYFELIQLRNEIHLADLNVNQWLQT